MNDTPADDDRALGGDEASPLRRDARAHESSAALPAPPDPMPAPAPAREDEPASAAVPEGELQPAEAKPRHAHARVSIAEALELRSELELQELFAFWSGAQAGQAPREPAEIKRAVRASIADDGLVDARVQTLGRRMNQILGLLLEAPHYQLTFAELACHKQLAYLSHYVGSSRVDLQACKLEYSIVSPK